MKSTIRVGMLIVLCTFGIAFLADVDAQDAQPKQVAGENATKVEDLNVRYARNKLEIARTDLEIAISENRRITNENNKLFLKRLETRVALAEISLERELKGSSADPHKFHIIQLEASVEIAKSQVEWIKSINKGIPGFYQTEYLKRAQLEVELKQLELERAKSSNVTSTPMDHMQWQIDQIKSDVEMLRFQLNRLVQTPK